MRQRQCSSVGTLVSVLGGAAAVGLLACGGEASLPSSSTITHDNLEGEPGAAPTVLGGQSCDALLAALQAELIERVQARADLARTTPGSYVGDDPFDRLSFSADLAEAPPGFTGTTGRVPGVDEGDFVKAVGDRVYTLSNGTLHVTDAARADALALLGSVRIDGAMEILVHGRNVVAFSRIVGALPGTDVPVSAGYEPVFTKLTVLDASVAPPAVVREVYVEGEYTASRQHGSVARAVVQLSRKVHIDAPVVTAQDVFGRWREQDQIDVQVDAWAEATELSILRSVLGDYAPAIYEQVEGRLVEQPLPCEDYLLPSPNLTELGATSVVGLDLANVAAPLAQLALLAPASASFGESSVVLLQTERIDQPGGGIRTDSLLHLFELDGERASYTASGFLPGYVPSLDQRGGVVRAHMTQEVWANVGDAGIRYQGNVSRVVTLGLDQGHLLELGRTPEVVTDSANAQFIGDHAYLLTSPLPAVELVTVDLTDPRLPRITSRLPARGDYGSLLPLPDGQLLAISETEDPAPAYTRHVALQLFDLGSPAAPTLAAEHIFPTSSTSAVNERRAISVDPAQHLLSLPVLDANYHGSLEVFRLSADASLERLGAVRPPSPDLALVACLGLLGEPTDPAYVAQYEQDAAQVAALLEVCNRVRPRPNPERGPFRAGQVFALGYSQVDAFSLDDLSAPPLGHVVLPRLE
jgi:hypothetical protein